MLILGLNSFHGDSSACLLRDGIIVAAAEEERFSRQKHWAGFPAKAIEYCLREGGNTLEDLDIVAVNHDGRANFWRRLSFAARNSASPRMLLARARKRLHRDSLASYFDRAFGPNRLRGRIEHVEHHQSHLASAYFASRFDSAAVVSVDGFGDFASTAWGLGSGSQLSLDHRVLFPHSLGLFYQAITQYLGFPHYGDEYKVMGLAPYGEPRQIDELSKLIELRNNGGFRLDLSYFRHSSEQIDFTWEGAEPRFGLLYSDRLTAMLGPARNPSDEITPRHRDLAASAQAAYERAFFHVLNEVHAKYGVDRLALSGGCAMNSVANGKVRRRTAFRHVYVQPAAGDAGGAVGAAFVAWMRAQVNRRPQSMDHAYWGPQFSQEECDAAMAARAGELATAGCSRERFADEAALCHTIAGEIAQGRVVGWFQGRMEWGPRALGNRSILGDPRRGDMKEILNLKIKRRESFRPFAPSILREAVSEWFEDEDDVPFMTHVFPIKLEKRALIPAVTHVDGSGRLQTVTEALNARYYRLIKAFADETGVPMVLNTSFNESEPIVCHPAEALDCFLRTNMDCLVLGDWVLRRSQDSA